MSPKNDYIGVLNSTLKSQLPYQKHMLVQALYIAYKLKHIGFFFILLPGFSFTNINYEDRQKYNYLSKISMHEMCPITLQSGS